MSAAIRAGYKQTEVGVIPEDWYADALGAHVVITSGSSPSLFRFETTGTPYFKVDQLNNEAKYSSTTPYFFRGEQVVPRGSLIFPKRGASILLNKVRILKHDAFMDTNLMTLTPKEAMDSEYLYYALTYVQLWRIADTTSIPQINNKHIIPLVLPRPPLDEQRAIATVLSDVDALLAKLDALVAKKRDLKQAAMQQLLTGLTRLPGFSGEREVKSMKSLGQTYGGLVGKTKADFGHGQFRYIPFMNVMTDTVIDPEWLESVDIAANESQNQTRAGDLFFNGSSETPEEVGYCAVLRESIPDLYLNSFCFGFRFNPEAEVNGLFFAYWFRSVEGRRAMSVLAQGATRYNIAKSAFLRLEIPQPSEGEQTAIATVLSDMDTELVALEGRRDKTRALKQGMMQELLTGRIRLV